MWSWKPGGSSTADPFLGSKSSFSWLPVDGQTDSIVDPNTVCIGLCRWPAITNLT